MKGSQDLVASGLEERSAQGIVELHIQLALLEREVEIVARWLDAGSAGERPILAADLATDLKVLSGEVLEVAQSSPLRPRYHVATLMQTLLVLRSLLSEIEASPVARALDLRLAAARRSETARELSHLAIALGEGLVLLREMTLPLLVTDD